MTESEIQTEIMRAAYGHPLVAFLARNNNGGTKGANGRYIRYGLGAGSSDLIGCTVGGFYLAVEVKTPKGKPTEKQIEYIQQVRKCGGIAFVASSVDEFRSLMTEHYNALATQKQRKLDNPF